MLYHLGVLGTLVIALWFGGAMVDELLGSKAERVFEFTLVAGYLTLVLRLVPFARDGR